MSNQVVPAAGERQLTAVRFQGLADVPSELEWFANIDNKSTRRAYENALQEFMRFTGITQPGEFRIITRSHVIAWRDDLVGRALSGMTVRHRLAALSSLFEHLCESGRTGAGDDGGPLSGCWQPSWKVAQGDHSRCDLQDRSGVLSGARV